MAPAAGIQFGKYRLIERLAHGGMAEVFLARQQGPEGFDRRVAIKRILPHLADSEDFLGMFLAEARLAASLSHPNVVHIYELGKVGDHYFIAMEYIEGVHAGALIERGAREPVPAALVARIGADACAGLNYVHNAMDSSGRPLHLVHRDISPPNLMISRDGVVKLMDFGIAKAAGQVEQTRPGVVKGKFAYMSPEQTTGETLDGRSDVFSLALVMWELLAGHVALPRTDPVEAMTMIRDGKIPPIRSARSDVPHALEEVLAEGLHVDREHRPSAAEFGNALEGFIKSSPELGTSMQLSEWVRRRFSRGDAAGEPVGTTDPSTEPSPQLPYQPDTDVGTEPSLEALPPISGETVSQEGEGPSAPAEESDTSEGLGADPSGPATVPAMAPLAEDDRPSDAAPLDPARSFLEDADDDAAPTVVTQPPQPDSDTEAPSYPTLQPPADPREPADPEATMTGLDAHAASVSRARRVLRILAAAILAAVVLGLLLWALSGRPDDGTAGALPGAAAPAASQ